MRVVTTAHKPNPILWIFAGALALVAGAEGCGTGKTAAVSDASLPDGGPSGVSVTMNGNDPTGSGANTKETYLDVSSVGSSAFGLLFTRTVDGDQSAQPLYAGGLEFTDGTTKNVVFVATSHDSVYAFDADDPSASRPLWQVSLGKSVAMPNPYFGRDLALCKGFDLPLREVGITATPVLDLSTSTIYVLALSEDDRHTLPGQACLGADPSSKNYCEPYTCTSPTFEYQLHALDMLTGKEKAQSPVTVQGSAEGAGAGSKDGKITFDATPAFARSSLLLAYGNVYFATGSYGDIGIYHGWIFSYDAATLKQAGSFCDTRDGSEGGFWQSGRSLVTDGTSLYVVTGNGTFNADVGGHDYGDSVLRLDPGLNEVEDYFSPFFSDYKGQNILNASDIDLGSAGALLLPNTTLLLATGKSGTGHLVDTGRMGKFNPNGDDIVQEARLTWRTDKKNCNDHVSGSEIHGSPTYFSGPDGLHVYVWGAGDYLRGYLLDSTGKFPSTGVCFCTAPYPGGTGLQIDVSDPPCGTPSAEGTEISSNTGGAISISSNGKMPGTALVWATYSPTGNTNSIPEDGVLEAYDATKLSTPIWSSQTGATSKEAWYWAKYTAPTIANGHVYLPTFSNKLQVYGLK